MEDLEEEGWALSEESLECPYCGESITMLFDPSEPEQEYVEDCEVCCNPIALRVRAKRGAVVSIEARPLM